MSEERSNGDGVVKALLVGAALGAVVGVLFAPRAGRDLRRRLGFWMKKLEGDFLEDGRRAIDRSKDLVEEKATDLRRKVERTVRDIGEKLS